MKKILLFFLSEAIIAGASGCKGDTSGGDLTGMATAEQTSQIGVFDIEVVRKNIIIKGQPFEIPTKLEDLEEGWTYGEVDTEFWKEGLGSVTLYYNGKEMFASSLENVYAGKENEGIIYNVAFKTDDYSIDGIIPLTTTMQEVLVKYGEPTSKTELSGSGNPVYYYGFRQGTSSATGRHDDQCITVVFDGSGLVTLVSITYADLNKTY